MRNNSDKTLKPARLRLQTRLAAWRRNFIQSNVLAWFAESNALAAFSHSLITFATDLNSRKARALATFAVFAVLAFNATASAEYRVFQLRIENTKTKELRLVESTLDPIQYPYYNTVSADERISYTETWRCFGRTGDFAAFCPNPKAQPIVENPPANP